MSLVKCKQKDCPNMVAGDATVCPSCGTSNPAVSYREEELIRALNEANRMTEHWANKAEANKPGWFSQFVPFRASVYEEYSRRSSVNQSNAVILEENLRKLREEKFK